MKYQIVNLTKDADEDTETINEWAADGWELVEVIVLPGFAGAWRTMDSSLKVLFRRSN